MQKEALKVLSKISPYIRRAWDGNMLPGWELKERVIFDYELIYIMEGKAQIKIGENNYEADPGQIYIIRPGIKHWIKTSTMYNLRQPHIHFDLFYHENSELVPVSYRTIEEIKKEEENYFREDINKVGTLKFPEVIYLNNTEYVEKIIFEIINNYEKNSIYDLLNNKGLFLQLLSYLLKHYYKKEEKEVLVSFQHFEALNVVKEYIRMNYTKKITLNDLTQISNFSKNHLISLFKLKFGLTPIQYKIYLRIERAKQFLAANYYTSTKISQILGFSDSQHFSKTFKKHTGLSPTEYRSKYK